MLCAYVFGSTAWGQFVEAPTGARVFSTGVLALMGGGAVWLVYLGLRLITRMFRGGRDS